MLWTADSIHDFTKADHQKSPSVINRPFPSSFQPSISKHGKVRASLMNIMFSFILKVGLITIKTISFSLSKNTKGNLEMVIG